jgi:hypothetical protein
MLSRLVACFVLALGAGAGCCHGPAFTSDRLHEVSAAFATGGPPGPGCAGGGCASGACGAPSSPFGLGCLGGCEGGCGEWYLDEWLSDPPKGYDPCDGCGNFTGHQTNAHRVGGLLHKLWGYRYTPSGISPYGNYHGYSEAAHGAHHYDAIAGEHSEAFVASDAHELATAPQVDSSYYDIEPGETLVPGSVRITEGGATGEPTPAALPTPVQGGSAPHVLPGPAASRPKAKAPAARPAARPAIHRQTGYAAPIRSPRSRP